MTRAWTPPGCLSMVMWSLSSMRTLSLYLVEAKKKEKGVESESLIHHFGLVSALCLGIFLIYLLALHIGSIHATKTPLHKLW